ncbi:hypothetical protein C3E98_027250 [Pseudomonas sp. MWU13-2625]|nr:hypothetical protein C3E98_027250 [Pseudomonas sp. MWU13-2625]
MFFTQPAAELHPPVPFDLKIKRWAVVERDLESPWFHVCIQMSDDGFYFGRTLLISDVEQLVGMLSDISSVELITSVMVMTPPKLNGSQLWRMEHVLAIDTVFDEFSAKKQFCLTTEHGQHKLPASHLSPATRVYGPPDTN